MWAVRGILCLLVLLTLTVYSFQYTTARPPSDPNTLSGCQSTCLAGESLQLSLKNDNCYGPNSGTFYNWTLLTSPDGVWQQIGTCYGCRDTLCSTTMNNEAFLVPDNRSLVIRNMTQQYSGWEVRAEAYTKDGRLVLSQHCLLNVSIVKMSDTSVYWYNMQSQSRRYLATCQTSKSIIKEGDQLKWKLRPALGLSDTHQHEYTLGTCTYRTPHVRCDNTVYRDGYNVNGDLGVSSRGWWDPDGVYPLYLTVSASSRFVSEMQGSLICQYSSGGVTSFDSRPIMLYRPATVDNCSVIARQQSAILSCDVSNVYSSDRNFSFRVVAKFKYSSQYDYYHYTKGTSSEFTLFTGSYEEGLTSYTNSDGALVYRGRLEYTWSLGHCVGAYHQLRVLVWPGRDRAHPTGYGDTYSGVVTDINQVVNVGHPEWVPDMEGGNDSISLQDDGPASVFCNYNEYNGYSGSSHTWDWIRLTSGANTSKGGYPTSGPHTSEGGYPTSGPHTWEQDRPTWQYHPGPVSRGLNRAAKVGIAVGCSGAFLLLLVIVCMVHHRFKQCRLSCELCCGDAVRKCGSVREVVVRKCGPVCEYVRAHTPSPPFTGLQVEADLWRRLSMWRKKKDSRLFVVTAGSEDKTPLKDSNPDQTELLHDLHDI